MLQISLPLRAAIAAASVAGVLAAASAAASSVTVNLNDYETATSGGAVSVGNPINLLAVPGSYNYGNPTTESVGGPTVIGNTGFGFYDDFVFTISGGSADSISSTISLPTAQGTQQISNLFERIYQSSQPLPVLGPVAGEIDSTTLFSNSTATVVEILPTVLAPGTYVLEVSGLTSAAGGSYSGTLNLSTVVPLPASLPLLLSALGSLAWFRRRRDVHLA